MSGNELQVRDDCDPDGWLISPAPACVDSLVACSSITPDVRATFTVWSNTTPWLHPLSEETAPASVDSSTTLGRRRVRHSIWICGAIVFMVGILGAAIFVVKVALNSTERKQSPSTTPAIVSTSQPILPLEPPSPSTTAAPVNQLGEPGALVFLNECTPESTVYFTRTLPNSPSEVSCRDLNSTKYAMVVPGKPWDDVIAGNFRLGKSIAATTFAVNREYGQVFYSISTNNGFNVPVEVTPMRAGASREGCPVLRCDGKDCEKLFHAQWDCMWFETLHITFCPKTR
ncbi:hypothetical protein H310_06626 [Aphanomyces invadans]|uniref:Uncharacterized protein n=1 Tax=Aphanomyces invadans TaxID=157072 RepID=A0A024U5W6_9STRA|nr:hypothetical protein H310_06626 [Aphanomyces invadans]ETW00983.1 hypothetical protein H310_06626 [Aphanomyces invadans]|eukprot:XP_008869981.1 hypothetical protein H310_06626 [Aphanomyces invadans]